MLSSTLGKQRANRRGHRNGAGCRFLAALGAGAILVLGVGAPIAAAQAATPTRVPNRGDGAGPRGQSDERQRQSLERQIQHLETELHGRDGSNQAQSIQAQSSPPPAADLTVAPVVPVPAAAPPTNLPSSARGSVRSRRGSAAAGSGSPPAVGTNATPPAAAPATQSRSPVARALRTARSYGALLALAAAVVVFLLIQGRVDRRDPRILSAPAEEHLSFGDFE